MAAYFGGLVRGEARPVWRLLGGARRGAGLAGEGSAGGASGRPVSGVDGAVRGFASFGGGAAPWPSGGEESRAAAVRSHCLQAAWQAVSWRPVRCAGEASGVRPAARGRAGAGTARWARASCFSTRNKVGRPKSSRGPGDLQRARGGPWRPMVRSDENDPGGCGHLLPILRTAVGRGLRGSFVGRRGVRPRAGSEARRFSPSRVGVLRAFPRASGGACLMGRQRGAASTVLAKWPFFARAGVAPGKLPRCARQLSPGLRRGVVAVAMNLSPSLSLPARAARDFFARLTVLSTFEPFFEPWRGSV